MKSLRVVYSPVGGPPEVREIENSLRALQELIGGRIQIACLWADNEYEEFIAVVDEEGRLKDLKPNIYGAYELLVGPVVITKSDGLDDFASLSDKDIRRVLERLAREAPEPVKGSSHSERER